MDLDLTEDEAAVAELFGSFFARESAPAVVRVAEHLGFDAKLWAQLHEMGATSMCLGAEVGGGGGSLFDAVLVAEQVGRTLAPVPFVEHVAATRFLERVGADVTEIVESGDSVTLALHPAGDDVARLVPFGAVAEHVVARRIDAGAPVGSRAGGAGDPDAVVIDRRDAAEPGTDDRAGAGRADLVLVTGGAPGVAISNGAGLAIADRPLAGAIALGADAASYERALDEWRLLTASALVGLAARALELGVAYVSERRQFGVPIGTFQAIQHGLADLPGPLSGIRLLVARTAWRAVHQPDAFAVGAAMSFHAATELARNVTGRVLHYHGGYGVMEEYDIQLYHRRARGWPAQMGDPAAELSRVADQLYGRGAA